MIAPDYQTERRMAAKHAAFTFPYVQGKRVLDCGCDFGYWSFLAAQRGADFVLGLDRNREVRGVGHVDLIALNRCRVEDEGNGRVWFEAIDLGKQWREFGKFDVILVMSMYHHWYENCGDHNAIWFWLSRHCSPDAMIIWEGPVNDSDPVVRANVSDANRVGYTLEAILTAAGRYFEPERIGPALHEPTREVWRFRPLPQRERMTRARVMGGAGGATTAFEYADGRRIKEIEAVLGFMAFPGSLNLAVSGPFDWDESYYRAQVLDVTNRFAGFDSEWAPRWARFYPLNIEKVAAWAFRFEGEVYSRGLMELLAPQRLRDTVPELVTLTR